MSILATVLFKTSYGTVQLQRVSFSVVPLVFIAWVKSKSMHGFGLQPLVVLSVVTSIIMRV